MTDYKLMYFNFRGRAETIRLLFAVTGVSFEDKRIDFTDWPKLKPSTPFGKIPVLKVNDKMLPQSASIARYLAEQFGLAGQDNWDRARVNALVDALSDAREPLFLAIGIQDEKKTAAKIREYKEDGLPKALELLEKAFCTNLGGKAWLVGHSLTLADIHFQVCIEALMKVDRDLLDKTPKLKALYARVISYPGIREYLKSRPVTEL